MFTTGGRLPGIKLSACTSTSFELPATELRANELSVAQLRATQLRATLLRETELYVTELGVTELRACVMPTHAWPLLMDKTAFLVRARARY